MTSVLFIRGNLDTRDTHKGRTMWRHGERWPAASPGEGLEQQLPSRPSEGANPADPLVLNSQPLEQQGNTVLLLKAPSLWSFVTVALANEHTNNVSRSFWVSADLQKGWGLRSVMWVVTHVCSGPRGSGERPRLSAHHACCHTPVPSADIICTCSPC